MRKLVTIHIYANSIHIEQLLCAARLWCEKNSHKLRIQYEPMPDAYYISAAKIFIDGKVILVDCSDSKGLLNVNDPIDVYYKRSLLKDATYNTPYKVLPFGFNYGVAYKPFSFDRVGSVGKDKVFLCRTLPVLKSFVNFNYDYIDYRRMHATPIDNGGNILYLTRLWDPATVSGAERKEFRKQLNNTRIETVKAVRLTFGSRAIAGIEDSPLARQLCPGIIAGKQTTSKRNYLQQLRNADICIATNGLENTLGWRIGEYVAFSKAVLTEPFDINIPAWKEEEYYKVFNLQTLTGSIEELLDTKGYVGMQHNNHNYYNNYLQPEKLFNRLISF